MYHVSPVDHTADKGLLIEADSLADTFAGAAAGMFATVVDLEGLPAAVSRCIRVTAPDREALLVAWLQELIFLAEVEDLLFFAFAVCRVDDTSLAATATGCPWPEDRPRRGAMVKAVTYHGLSVAPAGPGARWAWRARVIFDV
jgi:SHS2 domain-containing protein